MKTSNKKPVKPTIEDLEQQKRLHYRNGDFKKAKEIQSNLDWLYWGITTTTN